MTLVVDASVAIKWFVQEDLFQDAWDLFERGEPPHAPDLIVPEVANVAWKKATRGDIGWQQARDIVSRISSGIPILFSSVELSVRALGIARTLNHPVYDCLYISCAEVLDSELVTADKRLWQATRETDLASLVRHLDGSYATEH